MDDGTLASLRRQLVLANERRAAKGKRPMDFARYVRLVIRHTETLPQEHAPDVLRPVLED